MDFVVIYIFHVVSWVALQCETLECHGHILLKSDILLDLPKEEY